MGHQHVSIVFLLAVATLIGGCDAAEELLGICDDCVDGVDLAITELTVEGPEFVDALDSDVIAAGDTLEVTVHIRNRGREDAEPAELRVCVTPSASCFLNPIATAVTQIPAIGSNDSTHMTLLLALPLDQSDDSGTIVADLTTDEDVEPSNDSHTLPIRVERPDLRPTLELLASEAKIATQLPALVHVTNNAYVATASISTAHVCDFPDSWTDACDALDRVTVETPRLPAGSTFVDTAYYTVPESLLYRLWEGTDVLLGLCVDVDGAVSEEDEDNNCLSQGYTAQPNFEYSCGVDSLPTDGSVSGELSADDCSLYYDNYADVFAFDAVDGTEVNVTLDSFGGGSSLYVRVATERGSELASYWLNPGELATFTIASGGTYYLVVSDDSSGGYTVTVNVS